MKDIFKTYAKQNIIFCNGKISKVVTALYFKNY